MRIFLLCLILSLTVIPKLYSQDELAVYDELDQMFNSEETLSLTTAFDVNELNGYLIGRCYSEDDREYHPNRALASLIEGKTKNYHGIIRPSDTLTLSVFRLDEPLLAEYFDGKTDDELALWANQAAERRSRGIDTEGDLAGSLPGSNRLLQKAEVPGLAARRGYGRGFLP